MALQTKTFTKAGNKGYGLKLILTENSTNVTANTSSVSYSFYITRGSTGFYASQPFSWNITIGGQSVAISNFKFQISTSDPAEQLIKSGTVTVTHNSDGKKTMSFSVSTPDTSWISSTYGPTAMSMTGELALTTIPRASTISVANANIGSATKITISRASSSFTHTLTYKFGSLTGTIATKTTNTSVSWTVPTTFYAQITNAKSGTCTITCETFSGSTSLGKKTSTFTATASEALCKPSVSGTVISTDALSKTLTGGTSKLIRYVSTARATITATAKNSATIAKRTVNGQTLTSTKDFAKVETGSFVFSTTDSRGYSNSATKTASIVQYVPLTLTPTVARLTPTGDTVKVSVKGNYWAGNFGAVSNTLTLSVQYKTTGGTFGTAVEISNPTISGTSYSGSVQISGIDYQESYVFRIVAKDKVTTITQDVDLSQGIPVFDWGKSDFQFNVPVRVMGKTLRLDTDSESSVAALYLSCKDDFASALAYNPTTGNTYFSLLAKNSGKHDRFILPAPDPDLATDGYYNILTSKTAPDYVIATGATNNWRWRKWKSGLAECWQRLVVNTTEFGTWGNMHTRSIPESRLTLPFEFTDTPKVVVQLSPNGYDAWLCTWSAGGKDDSTHTGAYQLVRAATAGAGKFILNYYVQGFYK